jgi:copper chaperone
MLSFEVNDMTCGHCVSAITRAVALVDPAATLQVDLASHRVQIDPTTSTAQALSDAITGAGFTPVAVTPAPAQTLPTPTPTPRKKCCCG